MPSLCKQAVRVRVSQTVLQRLLIPPQRGASLSFSLIRDRSAAFMIGCQACNRRLAVCSGHRLNSGGQTWKAGWVQALAGSNPASSADGNRALTCGNAVRITSARDGVVSNIKAASLSSGLSFRPPICRDPALRRPGAFAGVRRRAPRLINPLRKRAPWRSVCAVICAIETTNL